MNTSKPVYVRVFVRRGQQKPFELESTLAHSGMNILEVTVRVLLKAHAVS